MTVNVSTRLVQCQLAIRLLLLLMMMMMVINYMRMLYKVFVVTELDNFLKWKIPAT